MAEYQVTCINKPQHQSAHEHITHIGNLANKWRMTRESAIIQIESKINQFFTIDHTTGKKCYIGVVREQGKAPFLRTYADQKWNDNLLAQPECDGNCKIIA
jgi:hypothetical protein